MTGGTFNDVISSCALSSRTDRRVTMRVPPSRSTEQPLLEIHDMQSIHARPTLIQPLTARNQSQQNIRSLAMTSGVSLTESKLIIALRKELSTALSLLENEYAIKLKLVEGARDLKRQLTQALQENQTLRDQDVIGKVFSG